MSLPLESLQSSNLLPANLASFLELSGESFSEKSALKIKVNDEYRDFTYGQVRDQAFQFALGLWDLGFRPGDKASLVAENSPEWLMTFFAVTALGGVIVPIDPGLTPAEIDILLQDCGPKLLVCSPAVYPKLKKIASGVPSLQKIILLNAETGATLEEKTCSHLSLLGKKGPLPEVSVKSEDIAAIMYTSGTTGNPKGVVLSHGNFISEAFGTSSFVPTFESDRVLFVLPLFHVYTLCTALSGLSVGASIVFLLNLKPIEIFGALLENSITMIVAVPRLFELLYREISEKLASPTGVQLPAPLKENLKRFISGGGKLQVEIAQFFSNLGLSVQEGYGLTETTGCVSVNPMNGIKIGSVGKVVPGTSVRITEPNSEGIGEIAFAGPTVFQGYFKNPALTGEVLRDRWFHTGDLGYIDEAGYIYITGRKKDLIVLASGKNVYPEEVEFFYGKSPCIKQIGVAGIEQNGREEAFALIVPRMEYFDEAQRQDLRFVEEKIREEVVRISREISSHKRLSGFHVTHEDIPSTRIGKIKRHELAALIKQRTTAGSPAESAKSPAAQGGEVEASVLALLKKHVPGAEGMTLQSHLELDLGIDSLGRTEIVANLEKIFNCDLPDEEVVKLQTVEELIRLVQSRFKGGTIPLSAAAESEAGISPEDAVPERLNFSKEGQERRLQWLQEKTQVRFEHLPRTSLDPSLLKGNVEHFIGMAQVPVGLAGPLSLEGEAAQGSFYVPLATTEGALIASVTRGMMAITRSGGARARVLEDQVMRAPVFLFERGRQVEDFIEWLKQNFAAIKAVAESTTRVGKLLRLEYFPLGRRASVRFIYSSGDASGQNMVTMSTDAACRYIHKEQPVAGLQSYFLEANLSGDKKMSMVNFLSARGKKVYADVVLKREVLEHYFHTTPEQLASFHQEGTLGSLQAGIWGVNAHYANVLAAVFIATGQDVACVHEASTGITVAELTPSGDLYMSVTLPNLIIATVGGGTGKGTQRECLEMLGCFGEGKVRKLAEIIAGSVLAGEISIAGAQAAGDFAQAHNRLGRNRPTGN